MHALLRYAQHLQNIASQHWKDDKGIKTFVRAGADHRRRLSLHGDRPLSRKLDLKTYVVRCVFFGMLSALAHVCCLIQSVAVLGFSMTSHSLCVACCTSSRVDTTISHPHPPDCANLAFSSEGRPNLDLLVWAPIDFRSAFV